MVFVRIKMVNGTGYAYRVQNFWDKEKQGSRQRVVLYLGKVKGFTAETIKAVFKRDSGCQMCGRMDSLCIDHKRPLSKGGSNDISNLQALCKSCNGRKGSKLLPKFADIPVVKAEDFYW